MNLREYSEEFLEELRNDSMINGSDTEYEFLERALGIITDFDAGVEDMPDMTGMGDRRGKNNRFMRSDAFYFNDVDHTLFLFISDFQDTFEPETLTMTKIDELYWRMYYLLDEICNGSMQDYFDESDDILKIANLIRSRMNADQNDPNLILKIRFCILTNKRLDTKLLDKDLFATSQRKKTTKTVRKTSSKKIKKEDFNNKPLEIDLWTVERFFEVESSFSNELVEISIQDDYPELGYAGIPCLKANVGEDLHYEAYLGIIPGDLLANIYIEHGTKILEGNVRAFLGTAGRKSVNNGIKRTIVNEPDMFFTYNNGIATTAAEVTIEEINGEHLITNLVDLQIINGGQTTATLAESVLKKTKSDLSDIYIPMKLTVIKDREKEDEEGIRIYDKTIQAIAKYANSQNKVTAADLFSNDPFHVWMERASKKILAPPVKTAIPTGWYYERSRKRYLQEQIKLSTEDKKRFAAKYPKKQLVTKEQMAMYQTTLACKPHIVAKGKNYVMKEYGALISEEYKASKESFNEYFFKKSICAAIIFRTVDDYLEQNKDSARKPTGFWYKAGGYKMDIVPYSIAKILSAIPKGYTLDWNKIWETQELSAAFMHEIEIVTKMTNDFICNSHGIIVSEYCKKEETWNQFKTNVRYAPSKAFVDELVSEAFVAEDETAAQNEQAALNELEYVSKIVEKGADYWKKLIEAGQARKVLTYSEIASLQNAVKMAETGSIPCSSSGKIPAKTMSIAKIIYNAEEKLELEGIKI